jgi:LacI family transcriptional regulator
MQAKVTLAIEKLGYRPQTAARAMRGRSYTIGVMILEMSSPLLPEIVQGITDELEPTPFQEILVVPGISPQRQQRSVEALVDRQVDGLILIAPWTSASYLEGLGANVPTVAIARHGGAANFDTVVDNDFEGAGMMVDHLVALGHKRIVHTSQPSGGLKRPFVLSHTARCDGYVRAMKRHRLTPDVIVTAYTEQGGYDAAVKALDRPTPPTAIFAGADIAAFGVLRAAEERGIRVPEDLTVTGYDNVFASTIGRVSLTTVDQSGSLTGKLSAKLLLERIDGRTQPIHSVISPRLVVRSTSAATNADVRALVPSPTRTLQSQPL